MDVEWNLHSREGAPATRRDLRPGDWQDIWPELADLGPKHPAALAHQAQCATESVARHLAQEVA